MKLNRLMLFIVGAALVESSLLGASPEGSHSEKASPFFLTFADPTHILRPEEVKAIAAKTIFARCTLLSENPFVVRRDFKGFLYDSTRRKLMGLSFVKFADAILYSTVSVCPQGYSNGG
jgi:hypothetical protein